VRSALAQVPTVSTRRDRGRHHRLLVPEGEQGMNIARIGACWPACPSRVGGITVNRFCASGLTAVQMAADRIRVGEADVMIAAGAESMSMVPMMRQQAFASTPRSSKDENVGIAYGMGLTAEKVAQQWKVSREAQDAFALPVAPAAPEGAMQAGEFKDEITPIEVPSAPGPRHRRRQAAQDPHGRHSTKARAPTPRSKAWPSCAGVRRQGQRHGRQQLADERRRRCADPRQRKAVKRSA
jgi:acetyl-CoA acetyltransferase